MAEESAASEYSVFGAGPFYELEKRIRLVRKDGENSLQCAVFFVALAWGGPLLLSLYEGKAWGPFADKPYLLHLTVWARFFVSVGIFVLMEPIVGRRLAAVLHRLIKKELLAPGAKERAANAVTRAIKRSDAFSPEFICLVIALTLSVLSGFNVYYANSQSWMLQQGADGTRLSLAAWWGLIVSAPIFYFLLARWVWRLIVWGMLLRDLATMDLRLVVTHPDGYGGIGFVGELPNAFTPFIFAISCVTSAAIAELFLHGVMNATVYVYAMIAWLIIIHVFISLPLFSFTNSLSELKRKTLERCGVQATRYQRAAERKVLGQNTWAASDAENTRADEIPDPSALYIAAKKMPTFLFSRATLLPVSAAALFPLVVAGVPLVASGVIHVPINKLLSILKHSLLL
jgi:hypothetical protein